MVKKKQKLFVCWVDKQFNTWTVIIDDQQPKTKSHLYWTKETIDSAADQHWPRALRNLKANVPTTYSVIIYFFDLLQSMQLFFSMFNHQLEKLFFISKNKRHPSHSYPQKRIKKKKNKKKTTPNPLQWYTLPGEQNSSQLNFWLRSASTTTKSIELMPITPPNKAHI